jgi:hypothetical protein
MSLKRRARAQRIASHGSYRGSLEMGVAMRSRSERMRVAWAVQRGKAFETYAERVVFGHCKEKN